MQAADAATCCFAVAFVVVFVVVDLMGWILGVLVVSGKEGGVARTRFECCCSGLGELRVAWLVDVGRRVR